MAMIDVFLKSIGFDPAEFAQACEHYKREFEGMKGGLQHAVQHFNTQLETVKTNQARIEAKLDAVLSMDWKTREATSLSTLISQETKPNGHDHNGR